MNELPPEVAKQTATIGDIAKMVPEIVAAGMRDQLNALKVRVAELEARPHVKYLGAWKQKTYSAGSLVSDGGSMWHCEKATDAQPGKSADWTLSVKRGQDGKDAK
jgi:hypothetical protein